MRIFKLVFKTRQRATTGRAVLTSAGIDTRTLAEGHEVAIFERDNPDWDFSVSVMRLVRHMIAGDELVRITTESDE